MGNDAPEVLDVALQRARRGDRDALGEVWRAVNPSVLRFLRGRGCASPDDVAAQVWIEVARGLDRFDGGGGDFRRWLFTIARRRAVDELRRQGRRAEDAWPEPPVVACDGPAGAVEGLDWALATVRRLPPEQAEVVLLRVVVGLDVGEVAQLVGKSAGAVRVLAHRGLKRLGELLGAEAQIAVTQPTVPAMDRAT